MGRKHEVNNLDLCAPFVLFPGSYLRCPVVTPLCHSGYKWKYYAPRTQREKGDSPQKEIAEERRRRLSKKGKRKLGRRRRRGSRYTTYVRTVLRTAWFSYVRILILTRPHSVYV